MMRANQMNLHIGPFKCDVIDTNGATLCIPTGPVEVLEKYFKSPYPSELEIEYAIAYIEDCVIPLDKIISDQRQILNVSAQLPDINLEEMIPRGQMLDLDKFERIFNSALRRSGSKEVIATLLIIRECLHHLRFTTLMGS